MCYLCLYPGLASAQLSTRHLAPWQETQNDSFFGRFSPLKPSVQEGYNINTSGSLEALFNTPKSIPRNPSNRQPDFLYPTGSVESGLGKSVIRIAPQGKSRSNGGTFYDIGESYSTADAFDLSTNPDSSITIYLNFKGADLSETSWSEGENGLNSLPSYSIDNDFTTFSEEERNSIIEIWKRVSADYAPWDVNITTKEPSEDKLTRTNLSDSTYGTTALITSDTPTTYRPDAGGLAYVGVFDNIYEGNFYNLDAYKPALVFADRIGSAKGIAEATSHEIGHNLGLSHDGTSTEGYYTGFGDSPGWAPIMGVGYYKNRTTFGRASDYPDGNQSENDFSLIGQEGLTYWDASTEEDNSFSGATQLNFTTQSSGLSSAYFTSSIDLTSADGESSWPDVDFYQFSAEANNTVDVSVSNALLSSIGSENNVDKLTNWEGNLLPVISIYDESQSLISHHRTTSSVNSFSYTPEVSGTYYLAIRADDYPADGSPIWGNLGGYELQVTHEAGDDNEDTALTAIEEIGNLYLLQNSAGDLFVKTPTGEPISVITSSGTPWPYDFGDNIYVASGAERINGTDYFVYVNNSGSEADQLFLMELDSYTLNNGSITANFINSYLEGEDGYLEQENLFGQDFDLNGNIGNSSNLEVIEEIGSLYAYTDENGEIYINNPTEDANKSPVLFSTGLPLVQLDEWSFEIKAAEIIEGNKQIAYINLGSGDLLKYEIDDSNIVSDMAYYTQDTYTFFDQEVAFDHDFNNDGILGAASPLTIIEESGDLYLYKDIDQNIFMGIPNAEPMQVFQPKESGSLEPGEPLRDDESQSGNYAKAAENLKGINQIGLVNASNNQLTVHEIVDTSLAQIISSTTSFEDQTYGYYEQEILFNHDFNGDGAIGSNDPLTAIETNGNLHLYKNANQEILIGDSIGNLSEVVTQSGIPLTDNFNDSGLIGQAAELIDGTQYIGFIGTEKGELVTYSVTGEGIAKKEKQYNANTNRYYVQESLFNHDFDGDENIGARLRFHKQPELIKDIRSGGNSGLPKNLTNFNGNLAFSAEDSYGNQELWISDGTELGTAKVKEINPDPGQGSYPYNLTSNGSYLYFAADDGSTGQELWVTNGTESGTIQIADIAPGQASSLPRDLTLFQNDLYFTADSGGGRKLWSVVGTSAVQMSSSLTLHSDSQMIGFRDELYFVASEEGDGRALWKLNGKYGEFEKVYDAYPETEDHSTIDNLTVSNDQLFFTSSTYEYNTELYVTDGTDNGSRITKVIHTNRGGSNPQNLVDVNGVLYFSADDGINGRELWRSDGTERGTVMAADIYAGGSANVDHITNINGTLFFAASSLDSDGNPIYRELWEYYTDTDEAKLTLDINPDSSSIGYNETFTQAGNQVIFVADNGTTGKELWVSCGSGTGTTQVHDLFEGPVGASPNEIIVIDDQVFFTAQGSNGGNELYGFAIDDWDLDIAAKITGNFSGSGPINMPISGNISATDPNGLNDGSIFSISQNPNNGDATIHTSTGEWNYVPSSYFKGSDSFNITVTDDLGGTTEKTISVITGDGETGTGITSFSMKSWKSVSQTDLNGDGQVSTTATIDLSDYSTGDDFVVTGTLASADALKGAKEVLNQIINTNDLTFTGDFRYINLRGFAGNLSEIQADLAGVVNLEILDGNITEGSNAAANISDLETLKSAHLGGGDFKYYGIAGTTKQLADSRSTSFDWLTNVTDQDGNRYIEITDYSLSATQTSALLQDLDNSTVFTVSGLQSNASPFIGSGNPVVGLVYRSDLSPDGTTSYSTAPIINDTAQYTNHIIGFSNTTTPVPTSLSDFDVTGTDVAEEVLFTTHFYGGEQLSHISLSGADLSADEGYSYQQTAGAATTNLSDDIWTLNLKVKAGKPAITPSVMNNDGVEVLGMILHTIDSSQVGSDSDFGGSVFRTNAWWNDISNLNANYKFSEYCPGINISGTNNNAIDFDFYFSKKYLERAYATDFDLIDGGFASTGLADTSGNNSEFGTYIDVSKEGDLSSQKLPVSINDVSATTAGGNNTLYQVSFTNSNWSDANLSLVYGPALASDNNDDSDPQDITPPTINLSSDTSSLSINETALISFTLSESSTDFTAEDVNVSGGIISEFDGAGTSYTAIFTPNSNSTTSGVLSVASNAFSDAAGNLNKDGSDEDNTLSISVNTLEDDNNSDEDDTPPNVIDAVINGSTLTIALDESIADTVPATRNFTVKNGRKKIKVDSASINTAENSVALNLAVEIGAGENSVTLAYKDKPGDQSTGVIEDLAGNDLESFTAIPVNNTTTSDDTGDDDENNGSDEIAPKVLSAEIDGGTLTITFDESIAETIPATRNFTVKNGRKRIKVDSVSINTDTNQAILNLTTEVAAGENSVTLAYKDKRGDQSTGVIEDLAGNDLEKFSAIQVTNITEFDEDSDEIPPKVLSAEINSDTLTITLDEPIADTVPATRNFTVKNGRKKIKVDSVSINTDTNQAILNLTTAVAAGEDSVTLAYKDRRGDQSEGVIEDESGNDLEKFSAIPVINVTPSDDSDDDLDGGSNDETPPVISEAVIDGNILTISLNEPIADTVPATRNFLVKYGRKRIKVNSASVNSLNNTVELEMASAVEAGDDVSLVYKGKRRDQATGVIEDLAGNDLQTVRDILVNNITGNDGVTDDEDNGSDDENNNSDTLSSPTSEPFFAEQWHLQSGNNQGANVESAWLQTTASGEPIYGTGVLISIVDDGLDHDHEDLRTNYNSNASYDFNNNDANPHPTGDDAHGTSAGGVAAGYGHNGIGISGAAPNASLSGLRLIAAETSDRTEAEALVHALDDVDIYSNSWGPDDDGTIAPIGPLLSQSLENGITNGRDGKGVIYTWAGGNGRENSDNSNYDGYANSRFVLAIGAISSDGTYSYYSEPGANLLVTAPSDSTTNHPGITTTDIEGRRGYNAGGSLNVNGISNLDDNNYTNDFGGTSSATPLASGIIALMLQANPALTWRDVQHVLVNSASMVDSSSAGWFTNGAGHTFNHDYGFGRIDADAAVTLAKSWSNVGAEVSYGSSESVSVDIPDFGGGSVERTLSIPQDITIETVRIPFISDHPWRGDLEITLTSPAGTTAVLASQRDEDDGEYDFTFSAKVFWGESSKGDWTLSITDASEDDVGTLNAWGLDVFGTAGETFDALLTGSSNLQRDAITGRLGATYASAEALVEIPELGSYLSHLDDSITKKELNSDQTWLVGTSSKSYRKLRNTDFGDEVAKRGRLAAVDDETYWIYEVSSRDLDVSKKNPALNPMIENLDDNLAFAYPLLEQQMSSRTLPPELC